jgi:hypothetical protein
MKDTREQQRALERLIQAYGCDGLVVIAVKEPKRTRAGKLAKGTHPETRFRGRVVDGLPDYAITPLLVQALIERGAELLADALKAGGFDVAMSDPRIEWNA